MTTGSWARLRQALQAQWPVVVRTKPHDRKLARLGTCPRLRVGLRRSFTDDSWASGGAYGAGNVGGQECRERGGTVLGLANSFGRVGIDGRGGTTVGEQGGAFVQQRPRRFAPRNEVPQRVEHLER